MKQVKIELEHREKPHVSVPNQEKRAENGK